MTTAIINIGLSLAESGEGGLLSVDEVLTVLAAVDAAPVLRWTIQQSDTEPTFVAELARPLTDAEAYSISVALRQDCIAQRVGDVGSLHGPRAAKWAPFNPAYFIDFN